MAKAIFALGHVGLLMILVLTKIDSLNGRCLNVIYTGEGCECEKNVPYVVKVPVVAPPIPYEPKNYGYKIEVPVQKSQYSYSFDFVVEEPKPKPIEKPILTNLIARIDRIAVPRQDCIEDNPPVKAVGCSCGSCNECKNRYLNEPLSVNSVGRLVEDGKKNNRIRRSLLSKKRQAKSFKKYQSKNEGGKGKVVKSKPRLFKRDIKGEFDLINRDAPKLEDLQIPEIIQFMPEVLSPNFQRGKCFHGSCLNIKNENDTDDESNRNKRRTIAYDYYNPQQTQNYQVYQQPQSYQPILQSPQIYYGGQSHQYEKHDENYHVVPLAQVNQYHGVQPTSVSLDTQYQAAPYHGIQQIPITNVQNIPTQVQYQVDPIAQQVNQYNRNQQISIPNIPVQVGQVQSVQELIGPNLLRHPQSVYQNLNQYSEPILGSPNAQEIYPQPISQYGSLKYPAHQANYPYQQHQHQQQHHRIAAPFTQYPTNYQDYQTNYETHQQHQQQLYHHPSSAPPYGNTDIYNNNQHYNRNSDQDMDQLIRGIIFKNPDFIAASDHGYGQMVPPVQVQRDEARDFLRKLVIDKVNQKFGVQNDNVVNYRYEPNRYRRQIETPTELSSKTSEINQ